MLLISYGSMFQILCLRICICYSRFGIRSLNIKSISLTCLYFWCGSYKGITIVDNSYEWRLMDHKLHLELIFNHFNFWLCRVMWSSLLIYLTQVLQQFCSFYLCICVLIAESRTSVCSLLSCGCCQLGFQMSRLKCKCTEMCGFREQPSNLMSVSLGILVMFCQVYVNKHCFMWT